LLFAACSAAGWAAVYVPWRMARAVRPNLGNMIDGMQPISLAWLAAVGLVAGFVAPRLWWLWGAATVAAFVLKVPIDLARDPNTHNLFPIELVMYGFTALPALLGAFVGSRVRRRLSPPPTA
jgi:hypothetical protein